MQVLPRRGDRLPCHPLSQVPLCPSPGRERLPPTLPQLLQVRPRPLPCPEAGEGSRRVPAGTGPQGRFPGNQRPNLSFVLLPAAWLSGFRVADSQPSCAPRGDPGPCGERVTGSANGFPRIPLLLRGHAEVARGRSRAEGHPVPRTGLSTRGLLCFRGRGLGLVNRSPSCQLLLSTSRDPLWCLLPRPERSPLASLCGSAADSDTDCDHWGGGQPACAVCAAPATASAGHTARDSSTETAAGLLRGPKASRPAENVHLS